MTDLNTAESNEPVVRFYRAIPGCRAPMAADPSVLGTVPARAFQYCEALRAASAYGWYVFPPMDFTLQWDGSEVIWTYRGADAWYPLTTAQFPGYAARFNRMAPRRLRGMSPPFLSYMRELSLLQVWTGLFIETAPDWSVLVRPPANLPRHNGLELYEGIIETDRWFGPLFTNIRLVRTDMPIQFSTETPLLQVQPLPRSSYANGAAANFGFCADPAAMPDAAWARYEESIVKPNRDPDRPVAGYAVAVRKRRKGACPVAHEAAA
jgi:hypothetical protein